MKRQFKISQLLLVAIITITFCGLLPSMGDAAVRARLDRQTIGSDETVKLVIEADGALNSIANIDTSSLEKDFSIVNQSTSNNFQIINGTSKATKSWTLELEPKQTGKFIIPPFTIGGEQTTALNLTVTSPTPITPGNTGSQGDIFIEVTPEMDTPAYLQGQITISVKLFLKDNLRLTEASLEEPALEHAIIVKLGDDRRYQKRRDGINYQIIERKYAIIAEEGDKVTIPSLLFQAISISGGNRRFAADPFFDRFSNRGRRLRARSQELTISLTPIPDEFKGKIWLPARKMAIIENSETGKELKIGEPLTRVIRIEALGLTAEQLPEIKLKAPEGCKIYLDQPEHQTEIDGSLLHAVKRQSMAFIPSQAGIFMLPEITIDWWDVVNNKQQSAVLPAREIKVIEAAATGSETDPQQTNNATDTNSATDKAPEKAASGSANVTDGLTTTTRNPGTTQLWQGISAALLLAWIITLIFCYKARHRPAARPQNEEKKREKKLTANRETIKKSCLDNNPQAAHQAILNWAVVSWPQNPPTNLKTVADRLKNPAISEAFAALEETLYSPASRTWDGNQFWQMITKELQIKAPTKSSHKQKKGLPPLYS
ncbi:MAG: BatD family protein [Pseudomonadota bacterium]|nr:BatD family protein [Pseudomonadota bacterium]